jgi:hypothetical protein
MFRTPTDLERETLIHDAPYDPVKAHEYYLKVRQLKGRKKGSAQPLPAGPRPKGGELQTPKFQQKIKLEQSVVNLQAKLVKLEELIKTKEAALKKNADQKKGAARTKKDTPKSAADKAQAARESKKYRQAHKQELKNKAKASSHKSGGKKGGKKDGKSDKTKSVAELKSLAVRVKGELAIAKQKLAAL